MARPKIVSDFKPDWARIKTYDRKYINLPYETVKDVKFTSLPASTHKVYLVLGILSFEKAQTDGWFPATMKEIANLAQVSEQSVRKAKNQLEKNKFLDVGFAFYKNSNVHFSDCYRINGFKELSVVTKNEG